MRLLFLSVLVTRPEEAGIALCQAIHALGGRGIYCPTIAFQPLMSESVLNKQLAALQDTDWLIFISPQAVKSIANALRVHWPSLQGKVKLAAVGAGTAATLKQRGFAPVLAPKTNFGSEGLLDLPEFQSVASARIVIIRGEGGRQSVIDTLQKRGARVSSIVTYRRVLPTLNVSPFIAQLKKSEIHALVCTSYDGVQQLKKLMGEEGWPYLSSLPLVVVSERIKILAHALGFQTIWVANHAGHEAIINELAHIKEGKK